jgi:hypothetical protein
MSLEKQRNTVRSFSKQFLASERSHETSRTKELAFRLEKKSIDSVSDPSSRLEEIRYPQAHQSDIRFDQIM